MFQVKLFARPESFLVDTMVFVFVLPEFFLYYIFLFVSPLPQLFSAPLPTLPTQTHTVYFSSSLEN